MTEIFMTTREVAEYTGIAYNTLNTWRYQGRGPEYSYRGYRGIVYKKSDVEAFLREKNYVPK